MGTIDSLEKALQSLKQLSETGEIGWTKAAAAIIDDLSSKLTAYEATGLSPERAAKFAELERDRRLLILPLRMGDIVYNILPSCNIISELKITSIIVYKDFYKDSLFFTWIIEDGMYSNLSNLNGFRSYDIGKTVFLTRAEAEAALDKRNE